jgi:orotidine-5'-phosphate decarboxylase
MRRRHFVGTEALELRSKLGENFLIVVPGIRPVRNTDDQKRTVDVEEAFQGGADYIVVRRPIKDAPDGPAAAASAIQERIKRLFEKA